MINGDYIMIAAPEDYPGTLYRDKYCYEHHYVYWENTKHILSSEEVIHHIDEDKHNNEFENLQLMNRKEHIKHHNDMKFVKLVEMRCPICNKIFIRERRQTFLIKGESGGLITTCSRSCGSRSGHLSKEVKTEMQKTNVIREFLGKSSDCK